LTQLLSKLHRSQKHANLGLLQAMSCAGFLFKLSFVWMVSLYPAFIIWLWFAPEPLCPSDEQNAGFLPHIPAESASKTMLLLLLLCMGMGFVATALQFSGGLHKSCASPMTGDTFFCNSNYLTGFAGALDELGAIAKFSVAAGEPKVLILRNWLGKVNMASCCDGAGHDLGTDSHPVDSGLPLPKVVDFFADEKHVAPTRQLWEIWAEFIGTSPDLKFLSSWATSLEEMTMAEVERADPFSVDRLLGECRLPVKQVAQVLGIKEHEVHDQASSVGQVAGLAAST